jgi:hypothetical protein
MAAVDATLTELAMGLDPALLMEAAGFVPDAWQARLLRSASDRLMCLASRQSGKSTATACLALHTALYQPGSLCLLFAPSERQSGELLLKVLNAYRSLGRPVEAVREMATALELANGSRIVSLPGSESTIRGFSDPSIVVIDEAAQVPADDLFLAVVPMVKHGRLILGSTPRGSRGYFHEKWHHGGAEWERITAPASMNPRIDPVYLKQQRRDLGERAYRQEHECEFLDAFDAVFTADVINAAFTSTARPLVGV